MHPHLRSSFRVAATAVIAILLGMSRPAGAQSSSGSAGPFTLTIPSGAAPSQTEASLDDPAWKNAAHVTLGWDFTAGRPAAQQTDVYVTADSDALDVAFIAAQSQAISAAQQTHGVGEQTDDEVSVRLWPGGVNGFLYTFTATPVGTRYQSSSENAAFAPTWNAVGRIVPGGYVVTMRIPFRVLRVNGAGAWRLQFDRTVKVSGSTFEWAHSAGQDAVADPIYAGITAINVKQAAERPQPRLQVYELTRGGAGGGGASHAGLDFSVPITASSTFLGTVHPDYSNVDQDQQSIAPSEFARQYREVRPFFTQGAGLYGRQTCTGCNLVQLYTPAIPTPRSGFAVEGKQGSFTFGAFDANGEVRNDNAEMLTWTNSSATIAARVQRVSASLPGMNDTSVTTNLGMVNPRTHLFAGLSYGFEQGTRILDERNARYADVSAGYATGKSFLGFALRSVGREYNPYDGYTPSNDIAGYLLQGSHEIDFSPSAWLKSVVLQGQLDRYHGSAGGYAQTDSNLSLVLQTRNRLTIGVSSGSNYMLTAGNVLAPFNQNGISLGFRDGSVTPTDLGFSTGRFGAGTLAVWTRSTTTRLGERLLANMEVDDTRFRADAGGTFVQWLERMALTYQFDRSTSISAGLRRIVGVAPPGGGTLVPSPTAAAASNLSVALHRRMRNSELFFAYGDPNSYATTPSLILKLVRYFGAEKGT